MPSTVVHVGFAALIAAALLGKHFDERALVVVMAVAAFPDLDTFIGLWLMDGGHRTVLHNVVFPSILLAVLWFDVFVREQSYVLRRWGAYGFRVAWVSLLGGWIVAHVLLDAYHNGVNLLWPLHDEFIDLSGHLLISDQRGIVQTFVEFDVGEDGTRQIAEDHSRGASDEHHYYTGADPGDDAPEDVERLFPIFDTGEYKLLGMTGYLVAAFRVWEHRREDAEE